MISAAPPGLVIEGDSAWIVILAVSLVTFLGVLIMRRLIDRPGRLASGLLLSLPLVLPLIAAFSFTHAALPVVAILRPVNEAALRQPGGLDLLLWSRSPDGGLVPMALLDAGAWMLWVGVAVVGFMLLRRAVGAVLVHRVLTRCRPLDMNAEADVALAVERLSFSIGLLRIPQVLVMPEGLSGAFAAGGRRARILVSRDLIAGLEPDELEAILAHEIAHIDAHDIELTFTAGLLRDLVAWNPVSHIAFRRLMADRELEADRRAADMTGDPLAVASGLVKACELRRLVPRRKRHLALAFLGTGSRIKRRVGRLLALADGGSYARATSNAPYIMAALVVSVLGLQAGARIASQPQGAYLIGWGATESTTQGFWSPAERHARQAQAKAKAKSAGPRARSVPMDLPVDFTGLAVKQRDIPKWERAIKQFSRRAGLTHEFLNEPWGVHPLQAVGPFSVYRLVPGAT